MSIRVYAVPGRLYPHPDGHRRAGARFIGRSAGIQNPSPDPKHPEHDVREPDARFPINPEGDVFDDAFESELVRAVQHGDLSMSPPSSEAKTESPAITFEHVHD